MKRWLVMSLTLSVGSFAKPALAAGFPTPYPTNYISFEASGLMTRSAKMLVDLDQGIGWFAEAPQRTSDNMLGDATEVRLSATTQTSLLALAQEVADKGMKSQQCIDDDRKEQLLRERQLHPKPPVVYIQPMDAMIFFSVQLNGKFASLPARYECESEPAHRLYAAMRSSLFSEMPQAPKAQH